MTNRCGQKLTINLAIESLDSVKQKVAKLKQFDCPSHFADPCVKPVEIVPVPLRKIRKKQIQICTRPAVEFVCPPVPCVCPPCDICPTLGERIGTLLGFGFKLFALYAMFKWTWAIELWGNTEHTARLTQYYRSIIYAIMYGEGDSFARLKSAPAGIFDIREAVYCVQRIWNKLISTAFYITIGIPVQAIDSVRRALRGTGECYEDDDDDGSTRDVLAIAEEYDHTAEQLLLVPGTLTSKLESMMKTLFPAQETAPKTDDEEPADEA